MKKKPPKMHSFWLFYVVFYPDEVDSNTSDVIKPYLIAGPFVRWDAAAEEVERLRRPYRDNNLRQYNGYKIVVGDLKVDLNTMQRPQQVTLPGDPKPF